MTTDTTYCKTEFRSLALLLALVLVVAVGFGVLVNTIAVLQDQNHAETDNTDVEIVDATVTVNDPSAETVEVSDDIGSDDGNPVVFELRLEVESVLEESDVDLADLTVVYETGGGFGNLTHLSEHVVDGDFAPDGDVGNTAVARDVFFVQPVTVDDVDTVMTDGDRYELVIPTGVFIDHEGAIRQDPAHQARVAEPTNDYGDPDVAANLTAVLAPDEGIDNSGLRLLEAGSQVTIKIHSSDGTVVTTTEIVLPVLDGHAGQSVPIRS